MTDLSGLSIPDQLSWWSKRCQKLEAENERLKSDETKTVSEMLSILDRVLALVPVDSRSLAAQLLDEARRTLRRQEQNVYDRVKKYQVENNPVDLTPPEQEVSE